MKNKVYWVLLALVLVGIAATILYQLAIKPTQQKPLAADQVSGLRSEYPLYGSLGNGMNEPRATDLDMIIKANNIYVEAEVLAYRPRHLEIKIRDILFQGDGANALNEELVLRMGDEIDVLATHKTRNGFTIFSRTFNRGPDS